MASFVVGRLVLKQFGNLGAKTDNKTQESPSFVWDKGLKYVSLLGGILAVIGLGEEYFLAQQFACITPDTLNRDQHSYIVHWCSRNVRLIDSLPLLILLQSLLIISPHVLWSLYASAALQEFYKLTSSLQPFRNPSTGSFTKTTLLIVQHLRNKYTTSTTLYKSYFCKLCLQGTFSVIFLAIMLVLYRGGEAFGEDVWCDFVFSNVTSENMTASNAKVWCSYSISLAFLPLWIGTILLTVVGFGAAITGVIWLWLPHWKELDHKGRSDFYYSLGLNYGEYTPVRERNQSTVVQSDIQLLVMLLFHLNQGRGEAFHDVQVEQNLEERWKNDYETLLNYKNEIKSSSTKITAGFIRQMVDTDNQNASQVPVCLLGLHILRVCSQIRKNSDESIEFETALHLYCGSKGCTVAVAKLSKETYAVDYNHFFYRSDFENQTSTNMTVLSDIKRGNNRRKVTMKQSRMEEDFGAIFHVRVPTNMASRVVSESAMFMKRIRHKRNLCEGKFRSTKYDLVVVTCMESHFRASTARDIIEKTLFMCAMPECLVVICSFNKEDIISTTSGLDKYFSDVELPEELPVVNFTSAGQEVTVFTSVKKAKKLA